MDNNLIRSQLETSMLGDTPLSFDSPESSLVLAAYYDHGQRKLSVELRAGKVSKWYDYGEVSPTDWLEFFNATSKGQAFQSIKARFVGRPRQ